MAFSFDTGLLDDWSQERFNATNLPELDWSKEGQMLGRGLRQNAIRNAMEGVHQETPSEHKAKIDEAMRQWAAKNPQGPGESDTDYYGRVKEAHAQEAANVQANAQASYNRMSVDQSHEPGLVNNQPQTMSTEMSTGMEANPAAFGDVLKKPTAAQYS